MQVTGKCVGWETVAGSDAYEELLAIALNAASADHELPAELARRLSLLWASVRACACGERMCPRTSQTRSPYLHAHITPTHASLALDAPRYSTAPTLEHLLEEWHQIPLLVLADVLL